MRIYKKDGKVYVENGMSKIRVQPMGRTFDPAQHPGKVIALFHVQEVLTASEHNAGMINTGNAIALAIPKEHINSDFYEWPKGVEAQVQASIELASHN